MPCPGEPDTLVLGAGCKSTLWLLLALGGKGIVVAGPYRNDGEGYLLQFVRL